VIDEDREGGIGPTPTNIAGGSGKKENGASKKKGDVTSQSGKAGIIRKRE